MLRQAVKSFEFQHKLRDLMNLFSLVCWGCFFHSQGQGWLYCWHVHSSYGEHVWVGGCRWHSSGPSAVGMSQHHRDSARVTKPPLCAPPGKVGGDFESQPNGRQGRALSYPLCQHGTDPRGEWMTSLRLEGECEAESMRAVWCINCKSSSAGCSVASDCKLSPVRAESLGFLPSAGIIVSWARSSGWHYLPHELLVQAVEI